jgi:uncharacterized MAPEG superfamily protein
MYEIIWENVVQPDRPQMKIWRMRTEYWISKATNTYSKYVILVCFSTATMVARTRLNLIVTLFVHCRSSILHVFYLGKPSMSTLYFVGSLVHD